MVLSRFFGAFACVFITRADITHDPSEFDDIEQIRGFPRLRTNVLGILFHQTPAPMATAGSSRASRYLASGNSEVRLVQFLGEYWFTEKRLCGAVEPD